MTENKDDYAIVIGINSYPKLPRLFAAHSDAMALVEWLSSPEGGALPIGNIHVIKSPDEDPSLNKNWLNPFRATPLQIDIDEKFDAIFETLRAKNEKKGRRLYFYFSGHGFGETETEVGLFMANAGEKNLNSNIGLQRYRDYFRDHFVFDEIVYILDCCRDPAPRNRPTTMVEPTFTEEFTKPDENFQDLVMMGAAYGAKAFEPVDKATGKHRGLFTMALLEGLKGQAADERNRVTVNSLRAYLEKRVPELAKAVRLKQSAAVWEPRSKADFVICTVSDQAVPQMRVQVITKGLDGKLVLRHGSGRVLKEFSLGDAKGKPWELELPANSHYFIDHLVNNIFSGTSGSFEPQRTNGKPIVVRIQEQ